MEELQVDLFSFMAVFEAVIVLLVVAVVFIVRSNKLSGRVQSLQSELKKAREIEAPEAISFDQYLRDEVIRNEDLIDRAAASDDDAEKQAAELLKMRKQFLQLEVEARALEGNPVEFQDRLAAGMSELIEQLRPEPESVTETVSAEAVEAEPLDIAAAEDSEAQRKLIDTQAAEFDRLRDVINNQQDAMAALREQLNARAPEIDDLDVIMAKLDEFEKHDAELQQCLALLEKENQRLKNESSGGAKVEAMDPAQLSGLQNMLHNQQDTISNLQNMIQELAPGASKAKELADALQNIQRANLELNSCVAVLEDENAMLRAELDAVNTQLEAQDAAAAEAATANVDVAAETAETAETAAEPPAEEALSIDDEPELIIADEEPEDEGDDEVQQLEIKVQELEALVEFKDAAIEELEKQYSTLESKYLVATGEKKVD